MDALIPGEVNSDRGGPAQPLLLAKNLRKHFPIMGGLPGRTTKVVRAVDDLSLSVAKGETLGVVGESGCGKSTVARLLIRLIQPDAGTMVLDGDPVDEPHGISVNELRRQVQMVFQDSYASLNPRLTIVETLSFAPRAHGLSAAEAKARSRDLLAKVGLDPDTFADRYPHELSGGQRQRVNIARALALRPRLVILDEATSSVDTRTEVLIQDAMHRLMKGRTTFVIAHRLSTVRNATRILVFENGRVVESGSFDDLVKQNGVFAGLARAQFLAVDDKPRQVATDAAE